MRLEFCARASRGAEAAAPKALQTAKTSKQGDLTMESSFAAVVM
jgi:hypothetical protein